jgi:transposase
LQNTLRAIIASREQPQSQSSPGSFAIGSYVKRNKNDAADAAAICEAVRRPTMRFVRIKSPEQQGQLMQHRTRDLLMRQRTQLINALRAHLAELGIVAAKGDSGVKELLAIVADEEDLRLPIDARASVIVLAAQLGAVQTLIGSIEKRIKMQHRANEASQRVETIPGIGILGATAIAATVPDPTVFRSGRDFAAWIGIRAEHRRYPITIRGGGHPKQAMV